MLMKIPFLIYGFYGIALAVVLFIFGWVGKRINNYPICRKCNYNLTGIRDQSTNCPECGRSITKPRTVRNGERRKRRLFIFIGLFLFVISAFFTGISLWPSVSNTNLNQYKPNWWLILETRSSDTRTVDQAVRYLVNRLGKNKLQQTEIKTLITRALSVQADSDTPWLPAWGNLVELAWAKNQLTRNQAGQYIRNAIDLQLLIRGEIYVNTSLILRVSSNQKRCGDGSVFLVPRLPQLFVFVPQSVQFDNSPPQTLTHKGKISISLWGKGEMIWSGPTVPENGKHTITLQLTVRPNINSRSVPTTYITSISSHFETVPKDANIISLIADPSSKEKWQHSISVDSLVIQKDPNNHVKTLDGKLSITNPPLPFAFQFFVRDETGHEWEIGDTVSSLWMTKKSNTDEEYQFILRAFVDNFTGSTADIIIRSSQEIALKKYDITKIWDGEIVINNVPVK